MAWTTPLTAVANAALTAAQWNASVRDNLNETAPAKATAAGQLFVATGTNAIAARVPTEGLVATSETTASTTYAALTTPGPTFAVTTGTKAIVILSCSMLNNTSAASDAMGFDVSGATTVAAADASAVSYTASTAGVGSNLCYVVMQTLTAGSNTFTAKYRVTSGTGTFLNRRLLVIPL